MMTDRQELVKRLRAASDPNAGTDIGTLWNLMEQAADLLSSTIQDEAGLLKDLQTLEDLIDSLDGKTICTESMSGEGDERYFIDEGDIVSADFDEPFARIKAALQSRLVTVDDEMVGHAQKVIEQMDGWIAQPETVRAALEAAFRPKDA